MYPRITMLPLPVHAQRLLVLLLLVFQTPLASSSSAAGQETLVGVVGKDFVLLGADSSVSSRGGISLTSSHVDKIAVLVDPLAGRKKEQQQQQQRQTIVAAAAGDAADCDRLLGLVAAHAAIREYEASVGCDVLQYAVHGKHDNPDHINENVDNESIQLADLAYPTHVSSPPGLTVDAVAHLARGQIASALRSPAPLQVCLLVAGMVPLVPSTVSAGEIAMQMTDDDEGTTMSSFSKRLQQQVEQASKPYRSSREESTMMTDFEPPNTVSPYVMDNDDENDDLIHSVSATFLQPRLFWLDSYGSCQKLNYGAHGLGANFVLSILDQGFRPDLTREEAVELMQDCFRQLRLRFVINSPRPPCIKCVDRTGCRLL